MIIGLVTCGIVLGTFAASTARADEYTDAIAGLASPAFADKVTAIETLGRLGDSRAIPVLEAMADNQLYTRKADGRLVIGSGGRDITLTDAVTGEALGPASSRDLTRINANNALRTSRRRRRRPAPDFRSRSGQAAGRRRNHGALRQLPMPWACCATPLPARRWRMSAPP